MEPAEGGCKAFPWTDLLIFADPSAPHQGYPAPCPQGAGGDPSHTLYEPMSPPPPRKLSTPFNTKNRHLIFFYGHWELVADHVSVFALVARKRMVKDKDIAHAGRKTKKKNQLQFCRPEIRRLDFVVWPPRPCKCESGTL